MKTIKLKTNSMGGACIAKVSPLLNKTFGEKAWKLDTVNPDKVLTVTSHTLSETEVVKAVAQAGYKAEKIL